MEYVDNWVSELGTESEARQLESIVVSRQLRSAREVSRALRSQFDKKTPVVDIGQDEHTPSDTDSQRELEFDVHVRVEHSVSVDYQPGDHESETYRNRIPTSRWDSRS